MLIDPVVGEKFFGRNEILTLLGKRVDALKGGYRQNVAITGHRLTGKSSLLNHFLLTVKGSDILPIYIEVTEEPFKQFATKFIGTLLYNFLKYNRQDARDDLDYLLGACEDCIPETVGSIKSILRQIEKGENNDSYSELLNLSSILKKESKKPCVVILDEFHNLAKLGIRDPFKCFGKKIMTQKDTMYIVASSEVNAIKHILSEKLSLLFGNFEKITLSGFDCETSRAFLQKKLPTVKVTDELLDFLIAFADGHPFYLDTFSDKINEIMGNHHFRMLTVQTAAMMLEEVLFDARGTLNQFFTNLLQDVIEAKYEEARETLIAISYGFYKNKEIVGRTGCNNKEVSRHIKLLIDKNLIYTSGNTYAFYDKMLRFWLTKVYHKRRVTLVDNISEKAKNFRDDALNMIQNFVNNSKLDVATRAKMLLESFNNELIEIDSKKHRLVRFDKVEIIENGAKKWVAGYVNNKLYLACIFKDKVEENDIVDFVRDSMKYKPLLKRRIFMHFKEIDINAKILAKEMKIWLWNLEAVNNLFDLFGKEKVVRVDKL
ncbi:MAG: ATP-binding protein [Candidatus Omnitrophica bacterium]|nr:ATP-binding protein [Candidatus Omnitrophota bacterium]